MEVVPAFVVVTSRAGRVGSGGSIDMAAAAPGAVWAVVRDDPYVSGEVPT